MERFRANALALVTLLSLGFLAAGPASAAVNSGLMVDGSARFEVLSPTLIRLEYVGDGRFEDRPTFTAVNRTMQAPYTTNMESGYG